LKQGQPWTERTYVNCTRRRHPVLTSDGFPVSGPSEGRKPVPSRVRLVVLSRSERLHESAASCWAYYREFYFCPGVYHY
jgi:hypothetical protein